MTESHYEEISLKELILLLLKGWKTVLISTVLVMFIAVGIFFTANPVTKTLQSDVSVLYQLNYITSYGVYSSNLNKTEDVIALIKDDFYQEVIEASKLEVSMDELKGMMSITVESDNSFTVSYTGQDEAELKLIQDTVSKSLTSYLTEVLQKDATEFYNKKIIETLQNSSQEMSKNNDLVALFETQLQDIPMTLSATIINPSYSSIAYKIQELKNANLVLGYTFDKALQQQEELGKNQTDESLSFIGIYTEFTNNPSIVSTRQFSAKTLFPISFVLGGMIGVFLVLFMNYWKTAK